MDRVDEQIPSTSTLYNYDINLVPIVSLIRSQNNINYVIDQFLATRQKKQLQQDVETTTTDYSTHDSINNTNSRCHRNSLCADQLLIHETVQGEFAKLMKCAAGSEKRKEDYMDKYQRFSPPGKYMYQLLMRFVSRAERACEGGVVDVIQDESLMEIMAEQLLSPNIQKANIIPDSMERSYVSFALPTNNNVDIIGIRVYPYHNDVGVRRVWEAGAFLADFLVHNLHLVKGKVVVELGAGVGLTGIAIAKLCSPTHVHMTDYTLPALENLQHNIDINAPYNHQHSNSSNPLNPPREVIVTSSDLDWDDYDALPKRDDQNKSTKEDKDPCEKKLPFVLTDADVLLAADVVYDVNALPSLVKTVFQLLSSGKNKIAVFASTLRNMETFAKFQTLLAQQQIHCHTVITPNPTDNTLSNYPSLKREVNRTVVTTQKPFLFPCYYVQPATDVQISIVTVSEKH